MHAFLDEDKTMRRYMQQIEVMQLYMHGAEFTEINKV